jgi:co-chaperonin GroES (HSP10)
VAGTEVEIDGTDYLVMKESDMVGVMVEDGAFSFDIS